MAEFEPSPQVEVQPKSRRILAGFESCRAYQKN